MKKALSILLILATVLTLFCSCKSDEPIEWGDYEYVVLEDNTVKITKYIGTQEVSELYIPSAIEEYTVTVIGKEAFKDVQCIRKVYTPDTLIRIEEYAFANSSIKNAMMNKSKLLTDIEPYAFSECRNLLQADMPISLVNLGDYAFYYCDNLRTAQFRGDPKSIGTYTFDACADPEFTIYLKTGARNLRNYVETYHLNFEIQDPVKS